MSFVSRLLLAMRLTLGAHLIVTAAVINLASLLALPLLTLVLLTAFLLPIVLLPVFWPLTFHAPLAFRALVAAVPALGLLLLPPLALRSRVPPTPTFRHFIAPILRTRLILPLLLPALRLRVVLSVVPVIVLGGGDSDSQQ